MSEISVLGEHVVARLIAPRVNRYTGLFFFDASFRPVPLEQHFIGVAGKPRSQASLRNMDKVVFDKVGRILCSPVYHDRLLTCPLV